MNREEFQEELANSITSLVHFTAEWCQPCKRMQPSIDMLLLDNPEINYIRVDVDEEADIVSMMGIKSVPTIYLYKGGDLVKEKTGAMPYPELKKFVDA